MNRLKRISLGAFFLSASSERQFFGFESSAFFAFMMMYFFEILKKLFDKQKVYFKKNSHRLLCVPFFALVLKWLGRGFNGPPGNKTDIALKLPFCWAETL